MDDDLKNKMEEKEFEIKFQNDLQHLKRADVPDEIWENLNNILFPEIEKPKFNLWIYLSELFTFKRLSFSFGIILLIVMFYFLFEKKSIPLDQIIVQKQIEKTDSIKYFSKLQDTLLNKIVEKKQLTSHKVDIEKYYERKIKHLSQKADIKDDKLDPYERSLYKDKLSSLDESIDECKSNLAINNNNSLIKKSLILAYGEKVKVLLNIIEN